MEQALLDQMFEDFTYNRAELPHATFEEFAFDTIEDYLNAEKNGLSSRTDDEVFVAATIRDLRNFVLTNASTKD